jgi:hypothetical protein
VKSTQGFLLESEMAMRRVPNFEGNERLKFTVEEQYAIKTAEQAIGYRSKPRALGDPPRRPSGLGRVIALAVAFLILRAVLVASLGGIRVQAPANGTVTQPAEQLQPETQSRSVPNGKYVAFSEQEIDEKEDISRKWQRQVEMYFDKVLRQEKAEVELCERSGENIHSCAPSEEVRRLMLLAAISLTARNNALRDAQNMREANVSLINGRETIQEARDRYSAQTTNLPDDSLSVLDSPADWKDDPEVKSMYEYKLAQLKGFWPTLFRREDEGGTIIFWNQ